MQRLQHKRLFSSFSSSPQEVLNNTLVPADRWPLGEAWNYHTGAPFGQGGFYNLRPFTEPLRRRLGSPRSAADYCAKAELMAGQALRAFFEGWTRNRWTRTTGVVFWMLQAPWPNSLWHIYEFDLSVAGAYFGAKRGLAPLAALYAYDDCMVYVVCSSSTRAVEKGALLRVTATLLTQTGEQVWAAATELPAPAADAPAQRTNITVPPFAAVAQQVAVNATAYHLRLTLETVASRQDSTAAQLWVNDYWLSTEPEDPGTGTEGPGHRYADLTSLQHVAAVDVSANVVGVNATATVVTLHNTSPHTAVLVRVRLMCSEMVELLPVYWDDNSVTLLPGETRRLSATHEATTEKREARLVVFNNISGAAH